MSVAAMSTYDSDKDGELSPYLVEEDSWGNIIIEVPATLPQPQRRYRPALARPYRNIGVGSDPEEEPTGNALRQMWVMFVAVAVGMALGAVVLFAIGDWMIAISTMPIWGLFLVGLWRAVQAEQQAHKKKAQRLAKRLRDMRD
ncbi:MAG: hypothetical protein AAFR58_03690 [Cyanobacteria bacterium J06627_28]